MTLFLRYGTELVFNDEIMPGTVLTVFWAVFLGALKLGFALPNLGIISSAKLAAGEIFSIIDRVNIFFALLRYS